MFADPNLPRESSHSGDSPAGNRAGFVLLNESKLRQLLVARDEQALVELVDAASPWLLGVTHAMLSDRGDAEDVVMRTFEIAWNRIGLVGDDSVEIVPWLLRIARNKAIDELRARRRRQTKANLVASVSLVDDRVSPPPEPNEAAQPGWHVHETVKAAVGALPEDQRNAIHLAYFQGLTQSEIAERLSIPLGTVKTRLRLAFDKLRVSLETVKDWNL